LALGNRRFIDIRWRLIDLVDIRYVAGLRIYSSGFAYQRTEGLQSGYRNFLR